MLDITIRQVRQKCWEKQMIRPGFIRTVCPKLAILLFKGDLRLSTNTKVDLIFFASLPTLPGCSLTVYNMPLKRVPWMRRCRGANDSQQQTDGLGGQLDKHTIKQTLIQT